MLIRLPHWGFALLIAGSLWSSSVGRAQDAGDVEVKKPAAAGDRADEIEERSIQRRNREPRPHKIHDADPWKKHPPVWSIRDVSKDHHPYASPAAPAPGGGHFPGGPTGRFGQPYYYTATSPDTSGTGGGGGNGFGAQRIGGYGVGGGYPAAVGDLPAMESMGAGQTYVGAGYGGGYGAGPVGGASYAAVPGQLPGDPYAYHFGPGYYRYQEAGHYRFPYYSYRRPWYFPGHPSYNRDTNIPW